MDSSLCPARSIIDLVPSGFTSKPVCFWNVPERNIGGRIVRNWVLHGLTFRHVTNATIANRYSHLIYTRVPDVNRVLWQTRVAFPENSDRHFNNVRSNRLDSSNYVDYLDVIGEFFVEYGGVLTLTQINGNAADEVSAAHLQLEACV